MIVAKNDLSDNELRELERIVTLFLDDAEDQARRRRVMAMTAWVERLDLFLRFNHREVLTDPGRVSHAVAELRAAEEYEQLQVARRAVGASEPTSDFDRIVDAARRIAKKGGGD